MLRAILAACVLLASFVAACSGNKEGQKFSNADFEGVLLKLSDLPRGWSLEADYFDDEDEEDTESNTCDALERLDHLEEPEGLGEAQVAFSRGARGPFVLNMAGAFPAKQTRKVFKSFRKALKECQDFRETDAKGFVTRYRFKELTFPRFGDDSIALQISVQEGFSAFSGDFVIVRRKDVLYMVAYLGPGASVSDIQLLEELVRKTDGRVAELVD